MFEEGVDGVARLVEVPELSSELKLLLEAAIAGNRAGDRELELPAIEQLADRYGIKLQFDDRLPVGEVERSAVRRVLSPLCKNWQSSRLCWLAVLDAAMNQQDRLAIARATRELRKLRVRLEITE
jgi:hypothetical protein